MRLFIGGIILAIFSSCANLNFYSGSSDGVVDDLIDTTSYRPMVNVDDKVSISVWNHKEMSVGSVFGVYNSNEVFGKWLLVAKDSTVFLPKVGKVKIGGISIEAAEALLVDFYKKFIKDPIIDIRVHSHEVTIIGQVASPGNYVIYKGNNSLAFLIGRAGGLDYYAKLDEVTLLRGDKKYLINLSSLSTFEMNRINLLPGDVLYFPTKRGKALDKKAPIILAGASITTTLLLLFSTLSK